MQKKTWMGLLLAFYFLVCLWADYSQAMHITRDTTFTKADSPIDPVGDIIVEKGVTLRIEPGVTVYLTYGMYSRLGLYVYGTLKAIGTEAEPIVFTMKPDGWQIGGISLYDSTAVEGSVLEYCDILEANSAIICRGTAPLISHCTISSEGGGIDLYGTPDIVPVITHNVIKNCARGIFTQGPSPIIEYNDIIGIRAGISITRDAKPVIHHNNFLYSSGVGTSSPGPIDARYNWWGTTDEDEIRKKIIGNIDYSFWLSAPVDTTPVMPVTWGQIKSLFRQ